MIDISTVRKSFPELESIKLLNEPSGQKYVFRAEKRGKKVVLKLLKRIHLTNEDEERFEREVETLSKLRKLRLDYVPDVYDHGEKFLGEQRTLYIIEQFIDGCSYRDKLRAKPIQPFTEVLRLTDFLLRACVDFEKASLVHRDIKPDNIMLDGREKIWVIDFGLVRCLDMASLTQTSDPHFACTLGYAPPEQMNNRKQDIDSRTDLFSIGIILYESIRGCNPHRLGKVNAFEIFKSVESVDLPPLEIEHDSEGEFSLFISSLTSRHLSRRPQTARDALSWFFEIRERLKFNT